MKDDGKFRALDQKPAPKPRHPLHLHKIYFITNEEGETVGGFFTSYQEAASFARDSYGPVWGDHYDISWRRVIA